MNDSYNDFKNIFKQLFQLDRSDLDFGIYRILNHKRKEVEDFFDNKLLPQVKGILSSSVSSDHLKLKNELDSMKTSLKTAGVDPNTIPKYMELKNQLEQVWSMDSIEQDVYSHLTNFFKRYYKDWDYISLRRYKANTYAIPYEWEEVKLYRANHDQYYIKTSENLKNYIFKIWEQKIIFRLLEASTEWNNNKSQNNMERYFALHAEDPFIIENNILIINFNYEVYEKSTKQTDLSNKTIDILKDKLPTNIKAIVFSLMPTEKNKKRTALEKHLNDFTAKHTFDYFIHKDLYWFLTRELDFYIKNEVLHIDDIDTENETNILSQMAKIKAIKWIATKIITMIAQLENFQKRLWEKKKFITNAQYCITLDRIPQKFYDDIIKNKEQLKEWKSLYDVEVKTKEDLIREKYLVLDTKFFDAKQKDKILAEFDNLDEQCGGLLINSENRQAINLLLEKYMGQIKCCYIDPPYNAKSSEIIYKNSFKHSSWISFIENRLSLSKQLLNTSEWIQIVAIDEHEQENLGKLMDSVYGDMNKSMIAVRHNSSGRQGDFISYNHEYIYFISPIGIAANLNVRTSEDEYTTVSFRKTGSEDVSRESGKNCFYPILVRDDQIIGFWEVCDDNFHPKSSNITKEWIIYVYPIDDHGLERKWRYARKTVEGVKDLLILKKNKKNEISFDKLIKEVPFKSFWDESNYLARDYGTFLLKDILGEKKFDFPKSIFLVKDNIYMASDKESTIIDFFAGSWTTGHAVLKLNREDWWNRKFIVIEMGEYFDTVTKPRIQKIIYSDKRKDWKPQDKIWISHMFKYMEFESYEDTLNNLALSINDKQQSLLASNYSLEEEYMLKYMLDTEAQWSLLSVDDFIDPFSYSLAITKNNETKQTTIDLVETFNYLIGLYIEQQYRANDYKVIIGHTLDEKKVLIIWRNRKEKANEDLNKFFSKLYFDIKGNEFDFIYVNGDTLLENLRTENEHRKVMLTEEVFIEKMFGSIAQF